jgi:hypothetical protein
MATKSAIFSTPIGILEEFIRKTRLNAELWYENIWVFSPLVPSKQEKNILALLS